MEHANHSSLSSRMLFGNGEGNANLNSTYADQGSFYSVGSAIAVGGGGFATTRGGTDGVMCSPESQLEPNAYAGVGQWPPSQAAISAWQAMGSHMGGGGMMPGLGMAGAPDQQYGSQGWGFQTQGTVAGPFMSSSPVSHHSVVTSAPQSCPASSSSSQENENTTLTAMGGEGRVAPVDGGSLPHMQQPALPGINMRSADSPYGADAVGIGGALNLDSLGYPGYAVVGVGTGGDAVGVETGGVVGAVGYGQAAEGLPGIGYCSPQLASQRVMSQGRMGVSAISHAEKMEAEESEKCPAQEEELNSSEDRELTPEEKLERSRLRNRDHSRKSRQRKKALVEGMKKQVTELGAYRMLVEQAHDLISAHTTNDRAFFTYASTAFTRLLGIDPQDLIGVQLTQMINPEDVPMVTEAIRNALLYNRVAQVRYRLILIHHNREHAVETSFRMIPTRLLAVTRVNGVSYASYMRH